MKLFIVVVRWYPRVRYLTRAHVSSCAPRKAIQWLQQAPSPLANWATLLHVVSVFSIFAVLISYHLHQGQSARPNTGADTCRVHCAGGGAVRVVGTDVTVTHGGIVTRQRAR